MSSASAEPPAGFAQPGPRAPFTIPIGRVALAPGGFFELLGMERSATTPDPIHTRFGAIPLEDTPAEYLISPSHSRLQLWADTSEIPRVSRDMSKPISRVPGQAWSLLRPNRAGIASDAGLMNTLVIEPAYHVGLVGSRTRQVRFSRAMGAYHAVVAWESAGNVVAKIAADKRFGHLELAGIGGRHAGAESRRPRRSPCAGPFRFVTQHYWSRRAACVVPAGLSGGSALEGIEIAAGPNVDLYGYAG